VNTEHEDPNRLEGAGRAESLSGLPQFWQAIYGAGPGFLALFSGERETPNAKLSDSRQAFFQWPRETTAAVAWIAREGGEDRELYQSAHLTTRWRRRKEDAAPLTSLYTDVDHNRLNADVPPPTVVVQSSPGRLQCYWRLSAPVSPAVGEVANRRLAHALGADMTGWDLTQLLRVPGTVNHKYAERPTVTVLFDTGRVYELGELVDPLPELPLLRRAMASIRAAADVPTPATAWPPVRLSRPAQRVWDGETVKRKEDGSIDRSAALVQIARLLLEAGASEPVIVAALAERDVSLGWQKYTGRRDAEAQYTRIAQLVEAGPRTQRRLGR
jgi:hypothetical protein